MRPQASRLAFAIALTLFSAARAAAAPRVQQLAANLYAYVSDNDQSSNATFFVGQHGIFVVDTGLNSVEGQKLLAEIRKVSPLSVQFVVNTHFHPDHQGGNSTVGPESIVISSTFTRERTLQLIAAQGSASGASQTQPAFRPASQTFDGKLTLYMDSVPIEIIAAGPAHTMGDVYVFFPKQRTVATGDLYLTNCSPAMDQGSAANWVHALDAILALPADQFVPGHFAIGSRATISRFRDYLADLNAQVAALYRSGATAEQVRRGIDPAKYADFLQFPQFHATFADNAETIFHQLQHSQ